MTKKLLYISSLFMIALSSCSQATKQYNATSYTFNLASLGQNVDFHTDLQRQYIEKVDYTSTSGIASGSSAKDAPLAINLSWEATPDKVNGCDYYLVDVFEGSDDNPLYSLKTDENKLDIYNLKINTHYSYQVTACYDNSSTKFTSEKSEFKTTDKGPRNLLINNVINARDLGGHGIKQGLIYRSGRFNESDGTTKIDQTTIDVATKDLKIKTEIDLRRFEENGNITASPLGESVNYHHLPMYYGGNNVLTYVGEHSGVAYDNPAQIKNFFELLADERNYPVDFHCAIGKDRTGCMAYLIEALCGMDEEYLYRDYLFSNFAKISGICEIADIDDRYGATLKNYEGDTLQEKTFNYLENVIGVSKTNLEAIQNILIDK